MKVDNIVIIKLAFLASNFVQIRIEKRSETSQCFVYSSHVEDVNVIAIYYIQLLPALVSIHGRRESKVWRGVCEENGNPAV